MSTLNLSGLKDKIQSKLNPKEIKTKNSKAKKNNKNSGGKKDQGHKNATNTEAPLKGFKKHEETTNKDAKHNDRYQKKADVTVVEEKAESEEEILRREALALGASEEDIALITGVQSGDESEQEFSNDALGKLDSNFSNDLSSFMKSIGLGNGEPVVIADDELSEEEIEEDITEEEEDEQKQKASEVKVDKTEKEEKKDAKKEEKKIAKKEEKKIAKKEEKKDTKKDAEKKKETKVEEENESDDEVHESELIQPAKTKRSDRIENLSTVITDKLIIPARTDWYNVVKTSEPSIIKLNTYQLERLYEKAKKLIEKDNEVYYEEFSKSSSQKKFLSTILTDGTLNDKVSALTLLVQEAPLHNIKAFDTLLGYCEKKSRNAALQSINALKDLLVNGILPDRKLNYFKNTGVSESSTDEELILFYFEDHLKKAYFQFITILERLSHDPILHIRMNIIGHIFELLKAKPEQEANLLKLGVNKLGDIDNKISAKTSYQILQLETAHPAMKKIVIDSIIDLMFKNNDYHTKYYSLLTLNQTILLRNEVELANSLVKTYFSLFEKILIQNDEIAGKDASQDSKSSGDKKPVKKGRHKQNAKKGKKGGVSVKKQDKTTVEVIEEQNSKIFAAILTGLNRAFLFSQLPQDVFSKHLDILYKITHSTNFNTSVQSLILIYQISTTNKINIDRYYRTLYESLLDQRLTNTSKQGIYLNLLYKSLKNDSNDARVMAFVKRILQICFNWVNVGSITGMLFLIIQLFNQRPTLKSLLEVDDEQEEENGNDETEKEVMIYDGKKRDPAFANADKSKLWELQHFLSHFHPTVAIYAQNLLNGEESSNVAKPDLGLFSLSHFLDKFVYKNAKANTGVAKSTSIMQPLGGAHTGDLLVRATNLNQDDYAPVNTEDWANKKLEDIKPDEKFFYQYFSNKQEKIVKKKENNDKEDKDEDESDLDDDSVWDALVKSRPEVEDDGESEIEDFSDFDEGEFSDDEEDIASDIEGDIKDDIEDEDIETDEMDGFENDAGKDLGSSDEEDASELFKNDSDEYDSDEFQIQALGDSEEEEEEQEAPATLSKKRPRENDDKSKKTKKEKKELPVFASADDYAQYLDSDDEDYS